MTMTNTAIDTLLASCDTLQRRTISAEGCMHASVKCFDACMRAFDRVKLPAEAVTFRVYFNAPVMQYGFARIWRNGKMQMWTGEDARNGEDDRP